MSGSNVNFMKKFIGLYGIMSNIEKVIKQAISTFSKPLSPFKYQESLNGLASSINKLTADDVGIDKELVNLQNRGINSNNPIGYIPVFENGDILVSIFVLKSNSVVPLHDHPVMHGFLKVLHGSVRVQSYSLRNERIKRRSDDKWCSLNDYYYVSGELYRAPVVVRRNSPVILSAEDDCAVLTPFDNNIHEVSSVSGPSAFLDILAPPYDTYLSHIGPRQCFYFEIENHVGNEATLSRAVRHPDYWTVSLPYNGPEIKV